MPTWIPLRSTPRPRHEFFCRVFRAGLGRAFRRKRTAARRWGTARSAARRRAASRAYAAAGWYAACSGLGFFYHPPEEIDAQVTLRRVPGTVGRVMRAEPACATGGIDGEPERPEGARGGERGLQQGDRRHPGAPR